MATATVIKPDHAAKREHLLFTDEHEDLRSSMQAWVQKELSAPPQRVGGDHLAP